MSAVYPEYFAPLPNDRGLSSDSGYSYSSFPRLRQDLYGTIRKPQQLAKFEHCQALARDAKALLAQLSSLAAEVVDASCERCSKRYVLSKLAQPGFRSGPGG